MSDADGRCNHCQDPNQPPCVVVSVRLPRASTGTTMNVSIPDWSEWALPDGVLFDPRRGLLNLTDQHVEAKAYCTRRRGER